MNTTPGTDIAAWLAGQPTEYLRRVCAWNDPNGSWEDATREELSEVITEWVNETGEMPETWIRESSRVFGGVS